MSATIKKIGTDGRVILESRQGRTGRGNSLPEELRRAKWSCRLRPADKEFLTEFGNGNFNAGLERAVEAIKQRQSKNDPVFRECGAGEMGEQAREAA